MDDDGSTRASVRWMTPPDRPSMVGIEAIEAIAVPGQRYQIGDMLGRGGMGEVVEAEDAQIGRVVAIKRMRAESPSERQIARFMREARIQGRLEHPAIVPVHELGLDAAGRPYFAMKKLSGNLGDVRAARTRMVFGDHDLDRTMVVVESKELLEGQKRGIAVALQKATAEMVGLERLVAAGRIQSASLQQRVKKTLRREHLSSFVVVEIGGTDKAPTLRWYVDAERRRVLEETRLGRRVLCTDQHSWSTERILHAFRGQWGVEELFRRAKKGGVAPWGPSFQRADGSLRLHTFATVIGLMLVSLARIALGTEASARAMMTSLAGIRATLVRTTTGGRADGSPHIGMIR